MSREAIERAGADRRAFFIADGEGVLVARPLPTPPGASEVGAMISIVTPEQDAAWGRAASVLKRMLPPGTIANAMLSDRWAEVAKRATAATGVLYSPPPGFAVDTAALLDATAGEARPWVAVIDDEPSLEHVAKAGHVWRVAGLDVAFVSRDPPPALEGVEYVSRPDGAPTAWREPAARAVRLVCKADGDLPSADGELHYVLGIVLEPEVVDSQGDIYSADEIRRACWGYMAQHQNVGHMHRVLINDGAEIVECYIAPVDFEIGGQQVTAGTWLLGLHILNDALWQQIKSGALTGLSIGGYAQRVPVQDSAY